MSPDLQEQLRAQFERSNQPVIIAGRMMPDHLEGGAAALVRLSLGTSPFDTAFLDASVDSRIEAVRTWRQEVSLSPRFGLWRYGVITRFDALSAEGQSTLLKILEEPPKFARFVLFVDSIDAVLPTIVSRCRILKRPVERSTGCVKPFGGATLDQFLAAERLAKDEAWSLTATDWLRSEYASWRRDGYAPAGVERIERLWALATTGDLSTASRRLNIEQTVLSCIED